MVDLGKFEEHLQQTSGLRTAASYASDARSFIAFLGDRLVSLREVEAWIASMNHGTHKPQTLARKRAAVSRLLGFLAAEGNREAFEALVILRHYKVAPPIRQVDRRAVQAITREQYEELRAKASTRYGALLDLLWSSGCRISEALGDPVSGIRPLTGADIQRLVDNGYVETSGKGGRRRILIMPSAARESLRGFAKGLDISVRAFPMSPQAINRMLHKLGWEGGAHAFRHAYRARLRQAGIGEEIQARLMGHGPRTTTQGYGAAEVEEMQEAAERLSYRL